MIQSICIDCKQGKKNISSPLKLLYHARAATDSGYPVWRGQVQKTKIFSKRDMNSISQAVKSLSIGFYFMTCTLFT